MTSHGKLHEGGVTSLPQAVDMVMQGLVLCAGSAGTHSKQVCHCCAETAGSSVGRPGTAAGWRKRGNLSSDVYAFKDTPLTSAGSGEPRYQNLLHHLLLPGFAVLVRSVPHVMAF